MSVASDRHDETDVAPSVAEPATRGSHPLAVGGLLGIGGGLAALEVGSGWTSPYGLFHDELYYWACGQRPGFGYVDHPPLAPWLLGATQAIFGDGTSSFAVIPALCAIATIVLVGRLAQHFGADRYGQVLAGLAVAVAPIYLVFFSFYSVNAIELALWTGACVIAAERMRTGDDRWWLAFGVVAGLALLNKHTFVLLGGAIAIGVVASPLRVSLRSRWLWIGALAAFVIASPNIIWNTLNDWPSVVFYSGRGGGILPATVGQALEIQILGMNPLNLLLWVPGAGFLLFSRSVRPYRPLAIAFLLLLAFIVVSGQRRGDRIAGAYPIVLAGGAALFSRWRPRWRTGARATFAGLLLAAGVLLLPASIPVLSPQGVADFFEAIDEKPEIETGDVGAAIPLWISGRLGWERFAQEVLDVWRALPEDERQRSVILTPHWVFASVIEYYARNEAHPPVVSPHNAYFFWRSDAGERDIVVSVGVDHAVLEEEFAVTRDVHLFECRYCAAFRPDLPLRLSYEPRRPLQEMLVGWRAFSIQPASALVRGSREPENTQR